ncbi:class I SAM-dependent methyltransferase [Methylobacterium brachiatum]|uniref:Class I SAM-dependent methyltransferase n=1 Tax=Methylobacterium brachiatum TaxID=269660 RepID=A0ABV1RB36_9HYPH
MQIKIHKEIFALSKQRYVIDTIELAPYGIVRVVGWSRQLPTINIIDDAGNQIKASMFRRHREDVAGALDIKDVFTGFSIEFPVNKIGFYRIIAEGDIIMEIDEEQSRILSAFDPQYNVFFGTDRVLHRDDIYGEGPPAIDGHPEIVALALTLQGPILDFGCGNGHMIDKWTQKGIPAWGIEIDRPAIRSSILSRISDRIKLYDGSLPLPFNNGEFQSVFASEVIEHIPDCSGAIAEIARVCRGTFMITVPDMAAVPIGSVNSIVPWHLLESTHVNFFCRTSLEAILKPFFREFDFYNLAPGTIEDGYMPGSLGCIARK